MTSSSTTDSLSLLRRELKYQVMTVHENSQFNHNSNRSAGCSPKWKRCALPWKWATSAPVSLERTDDLK